MPPPGSYDYCAFGFHAHMRILPGGVMTPSDSSKKKNAGVSRRSFLGFPKDSADAFGTEMVFLCQFFHFFALPESLADGMVSLFQLGPVGGVAAPGAAVFGLAGDVKGGPVHVLLDQGDDLAGKDIFCFYIAHICLLF